MAAVVGGHLDVVEELIQSNALLDAEVLKLVSIFRTWISAAVSNIRNIYIYTEREAVDCR